MESLYAYLQKCLDNEEELEIIVGDPPRFLQGKIKTIDFIESSLLVNSNNRKIGFKEILGFPQEDF